MSNNCLVTKLKGNVNNTNIPYYGEFKIKFRQLSNPDSGAYSLLILARNNLKVFCKDGGTFSIKEIGGNYVSGLNSYEFIKGEKEGFFIKGNNANYEIIITEKYNIHSIQTVASECTGDYRLIDKGYLIDCSQLDYSAITDINIPKNADVDHVINPKDLSSFYNIIGSNINIDCFAGINANNFSNSLYPGDQYIKTQGSILSLSKMINMTGCNFGGATGVYGEVDDLLSAMYDNGNGKTNGTISLMLIGTSCTDEGNPITLEYIQSKGGTYYISATFAPSGYTKSY